MISLALILALAASPTPSKKEKAPPKPRPTIQSVAIKSDFLRVMEKQHKATYWGNVKVNRGKVEISCDRMVIDYQDAIDDITKIVCTGNVHIADGEKKARSQHADFDNVKGVLVLTGKPELHRGSTVIHGSKITYQTDGDDLVVEDATILSDTSKAAGALSTGQDGGTRSKRDGGTVK